MRRRLLSLLTALLLAAAAVARADETGTIVATVRDAQTDAPLSGARVVLLGPTTASSSTVADGSVRYSDVPTGIYRIRVLFKGFRALTSAEFEVVPGTEIHLEALLSPAKLKKIGSVRAQIRIMPEDVSETSATRKVSDSLVDALDKVAGVSITQPSTDPGSPVNVSLNNHDESQTEVTIDGIPLSAPGKTVNLTTVNPDLFTGAAVDFTPRAGALGGSVGFRGIEPTKTWMESATGSSGTFDHYTEQLRVSGSIGALGIASTYVERGSNNPLTFDVYGDSSGLSYAHGGEQKSEGELTKLRLSLSERTTVTAAAMSTNAGVAALCIAFVTNVPCGIGPQNVSFNRFRMAYGILTSSIGDVDVHVSAYSNRHDDFVDHDHALIAGIPAPVGDADTTAFSGKSLEFDLTRERYSLRADAEVGETTTRFLPTIADPFDVAAVSSQSSKLYKLSGTMNLGPRIEETINGSAMQVAGFRSTVLVGSSAEWHPSSSDALREDVSFGSTQEGSPVLPGTLSDPTTAHFNCDAHSVFVTGPSDSPGPESTQDYMLSWQHSAARATWDVRAFRQNQDGQLLNAIVAGASEPIGFFPPGYVDQLNLLWNLPTICGGSTFDPDGIYVQQQIAGTKRLYQGVDANLRVPLGRALAGYASYSLNEAELSATDARFAGLESTSIVGAQLPGRPLHRANATLDWQPRHVEIVANVQYTGAGNFRNLPPYAVLTVGVLHPLAYGDLSILFGNVLNEPVGRFASDALGLPVRLAGGGQLIVAGYPLLPRSITASYTMHIGRKRAAPHAGGGPLGIDFRPPPPGVDPLSVDATRATCTSDARKDAALTLDVLRSLTSRYHDGANLPDVSIFHMVVHPQTDTSRLFFELVPNIDFLHLLTSGNVPTAGPQFDAFRHGVTLLSCAYITTLSRDRARAMGIVPSSNADMFGFEPTIGIFSLPRLELPSGGGSVRDSN